jgi:hypothetical protein
MKIYMSSYRDNWLSPYTIINYMFFWTDWSKCGRYKGIWNDDINGRYIEHPDWVEKLADIINPFSVGLQKVLSVIRPEICYIKIDRWDTWSMDHTLSHIILPMLKQLHASKHGAPLVDDEDVPDELKSTSAPPKENDYDTDANHFKRWDWVLDEMIFAFDHKVNEEWQDQFYTGTIDTHMVPVDADGNVVPKGEHKYYRMDDGPNHTWKCDYEGLRAVEARIQNGCRLFGKYYSSLWD